MESLGFRKSESPLESLGLQKSEGLGGGGTGLARGRGFLVGAVREPPVSPGNGL
jgi:hypothetical protein